MIDIKNINLDDFIVRKFTKELEKDSTKTVYDLFEWKRVDVSLKDYKTGKMLYDEKDLEFPIHYSQNACDIIAQKYFKRANVPNDRGKEYSMRQIVHRMVRFWTDALIDEGLLNENNSKVFYDEVAYGILAQYFAPNTPQWLNTGLKYYNTGENSDGHYYYDIDKKEVVLSKDKYSRTQASACFITEIEDKLLGDKSISEQYVTETRLFKHGSGIGSNFSNIRAIGEKLAGGGTSSGVMSFLQGFDKNAGTIKSGGTARRAAKMVVLDIDHPEIMDFIKWKSKQEQIVRDLGKMGYDIDFNGEAYQTVSGQNGNNSIRFSEEFMKKVEKLRDKKVDEDFELKGRVDSSVNKKIKVSELWNEFNKSAWECADPAPQFDDTFNAWHTCPMGEDGQLWAKHNRNNSTNPCNEYAFLDDTSCNLASMNLYRFYNEETNAFNLDIYKHCITLLQLVLEASIHWGQFPTKDVARKTHMFRTTGIGHANIAGVVMAMGIPYDSDECRNITSALTSLMTGYSYFVSSLMAKKVGAFEKFEINKPYMMEVIRNHARVSGARNDKYERLTYKPTKLDHNVLHKLGMKELSQLVKDIWNLTIEMGEKYAYRNSFVSVIAPTGTISFAMDCDSTSIEPFYAHVIYKKLFGGGFMEIVNPKIPIALKRLGYTENQIKDIMDYILRKEKINENGYEYEKISDGKIEGSPHLKEEHLPIFDTANKCGSGERYIKPMGHVLMMASITPMVSGAISKTVNLPKSATVQDFEEVHFSAWKLGIKGISLYRDGCKASQPLNSTIDLNTEVKFEDMKYNDLVNIAYELKKKVENPIRNRPTGIRPANWHEATLDGLKLLVSISFYDNGKLAELYIEADKEGSLITGMLDSVSKLISKMIQFNIPVKDIIKTLKGQKYEPHGFVTGHPYIKYADSISDLLAKILEIEIGDYSSCQIKPEKQLINNASEIIIKPISEFKHDSKPTGDRIYGKTCPTCGSTHMVKNGTCHLCQDCGATTGCS